MDVLQMDGMYNISLLGGQARAILIEGTQLVERARQMLGADEDLIDNALRGLILSGGLEAEDIDGETAVYLPWYHEAETDAAFRLARLLRSFEGGGDAEALAERAIAEVEAGEEMRLCAEQREAVEAVAREGVLVITGGPGTGKTTALKCILHLLDEVGGAELCAPTGRAAKRMSEATGRPARTIHRLLEYAGEEGRAAAPNLLLVDAGRDLHDFSAAAPGEVLVTDITEFRLPDDPRKVYLSPAVDLFDGDVAAFSVGTSPSKALVAEMLAGAVAAAGGGFTLHSDRGWHYRTPDWVRACGEAGVERSMSRKGHSPDNAACEGFFGRLKVEFFHGRDWRGVSAERFAAELAEWIRWYREGRLKAFDEGGRKVYDTIAGRRRRLGLAA